MPILEGNYAVHNSESGDNVALLSHKSVCPNMKLITERYKEGEIFVYIIILISLIALIYLTFWQDVSC